MLHLNILSECLDRACTLASLDPGNLVYRQSSDSGLPCSSTACYSALPFPLCRILQNLQSVLSHHIAPALMVILHAKFSVSPWGCAAPHTADRTPHCMSHATSQKQRCKAPSRSPGCITTYFWVPSYLVPFLQP